MDRSDGNGAWDLLVEWLKRRLQPKRDLVKEMEDLIEEGTAEGVLNEEEEEMLLSVLSFRRTIVREVMVPRTEMASVELSASLDVVVKTMLEEGHSRIPVYENDVDHIVGFVNARDLLRYWREPESAPPLREIFRPAYFIPETMSLEALLGEFKRRRVHLAVAVDEYGGVSGLITMEDVLEEIVGEIHDEFDEEETEIREAEDGFRVDARTELEKLGEHLEVELGEEGDFETVGGLVFHVLGRIPRPGDSFQHKGLEITVQDADKRRVKLVKIRKLPRREPDGEQGQQPGTS